MLCFSFIIGLFWGFFLLCLVHHIDSIAHFQQFLTGRSHCPLCHHNLQSVDLIPILSFLLLKGKCRYCKHSISLLYPISELLTGVFFAISYHFYQFSLAHHTYIGLLTILSIMAYQDLLSGFVFDRFQLIFLFGSLLHLYSNQLTLHPSTFCFMLAILFLLYIYNHEWMGGADYKTLLIMSLSIPFNNLSTFLFILSASALCYASSSHQTHQAIPFIPFISLSYLITIIQ